MDEDLWNVKRTALYLGLNVQTVYLRVRRGEMQHRRVGKRGIRFDPAWVREYRVKEQAEEAEAAL